MSSPLALAAVTAVLKEQLSAGLAEFDLSPVGSFEITALPPDRVTTGDTEPNRLNLFLYRVSPNPGWRNAGLPAYGSDGQPTGNPPLALDLHYMLSAYGAKDLHAEILLGCAMELLHERPLLTRDAIRRSFAAAQPSTVGAIEPDRQGRSAADLAEQIETLKITPHYLSADELSKLWTAMQSRYRPTVTYEVTTVLIQGHRPLRTPLPVLARGDGDTGVQSQPRLGTPPPRVPTLLGLTLPDTTRLAAEMGDLVELTGALLSGNTVAAEFRHPLLAAPLVRPLEPGASAEQARLRIPQSQNAALPGHDAAADATWPAGHYTLALRIERAGQPTVRTNELPLSLAPRLTAVPQVAGQAADPQLVLAMAPQVWPKQRVEAFVGSDPCPVGTHANKTASLTLSVKDAKRSAGPVPVRLRIDGVDNELVRDRSRRPPQFDPQQCVSLPP